MRRVLMIPPSLAFLAACAGGPPPQTNIPQTGVTASFPPGGIVGVIHVDAIEREPLRAAALVAPDGSVTNGSAPDVDANPRTLGGQAALSDPWRASVFGVNGLSPLSDGGFNATVRSQNQVLVMVSKADIALPDPVAYRQAWQNYRIRLSFAGADNQPDVREIPAPAPPPEQAGS